MYNVYNVYNAYNVYNFLDGCEQFDSSAVCIMLTTYIMCNAYNDNAYNVYNVYNVPDGAQSDRSRARQSATGGAIHTHATAMRADE